ncbi:hypothetical protein ACM9HF_09440 [Colwellia sp. RE-S-Sl-9]
MSIKHIFIIFILFSLVSCSTLPPKNPENICSIFEQNTDWYFAAKKAKDKWGVPIHVPMSMMYQESSFKHDAIPPMDYFLGFIPIGRVSSAYGYSQAKTMTWNDYMKETGNSGADRDDFDDAMDFMGWFIYKSQKLNKTSKWDAYNQYLNYHEGWGGFKRKSYYKKKWLMAVSRKVEKRAKRYSAQLKKCEASFNQGWWSRLFSS